ncbi:hypothetical protein J5N97_028422 [Dioscorea zingiberensis]|uniref:Plastocyanin-like domain-containing protein n=1 Tax=Dioscorea zingiberensis TaxID=325984 RepID=A0A9D5H4U6_9LILI|nr:hypothetical protein J5N97_028422 [Dioscorea zingiberensis]
MREVALGSGSGLLWVEDRRTGLQEADWRTCGDGALARGSWATDLARSGGFKRDGGLATRSGRGFGGRRLRGDTYALEVEMEKTYLLRIVNAALNDEIFFAIAGHNMIVTLSCRVSLHTPRFPANERLTVHRRLFYT